MLLPKIAFGVLRGLRAFWIVWLGAGAVLGLALGFFLELPLQYPETVAVVVLSLPVSLIAHEYGHARAAMWCGAGQLRLERQGLSVAVSHQELGPAADALVALAGPASSLLAAATVMLCGVIIDSTPVMLGSVLIAAGALSVLPTAHDGRTILLGARYVLAARSLADVREPSA